MERTKALTSPRLLFGRIGITGARAGSTTRILEAFRLGSYSGFFEPQKKSVVELAIGVRFAFQNAVLNAFLLHLIDALALFLEFPGECLFPVEGCRVLILGSFDTIRLFRFDRHRDCRDLVLDLFSGTEIRPEPRSERRVLFAQFYQLGAERSRYRGIRIQNAGPGYPGEPGRGFFFYPLGLRFGVCVLQIRQTLRFGVFRPGPLAIFDDEYLMSPAVRLKIVLGLLEVCPQRCQLLPEKIGGDLSGVPPRLQVLFDEVFGMGIRHLRRQVRIGAVEADVDEARSEDRCDEKARQIGVHVRPHRIFIRRHCRIRARFRRESSRQQSSRGFLHSIPCAADKTRRRRACALLAHSREFRLQMQIFDNLPGQRLGGKYSVLRLQRVILRVGSRRRQSIE